MLRKITDDPWASYTLCCTCCGACLSAEDEVDPRREGTDVLCEDCWHHRHEFPCAWCEEYDDTEVQHRYVAVFDPDAVALALPGLYRVERCPYYTDAMLSAWLNEDALTWLGYLPADVQREHDAGYACGHFCRTCQGRALAHITFMLRCGVAAIH